MEKPSSGMILLTDQELKEMSDFVEKNYGIVLIKKKTLIQGRLSHTLRERGLSSFREYMDLIYKDKSGVEITNFLNKITTNHSYFMREEEHFRFLRETVLPYLEANRPNKVLRIWSAACSAGQEPFTLAMAIDEYFGSRKAAWDTTILATDLSAQFLERAKRAVYPEGDQGCFRRLAHQIFQKAPRRELSGLRQDPQGSHLPEDESDGSLPVQASL